MTPPCFAQARLLLLLKSALAVAPAASHWWQRYWAGGIEREHSYLLSGVYQQLEKEHYQGPGMAELQRSYLATWTRHLQQLQLASQALLALQAGGLQPVLLKGLAVSCLLGWSGHRAMDDFDLLVRPQELELAARLLAELGWTADQPLPTPAGRAIQHSGSWQRQGHSLDLHWFIHAGEARSRPGPAVPGAGPHG